MGFSRYAVPQQGVIVRTGAERATLVRRTYSLVFASVLVTIAATAWAMTQPSMMQGCSGIRSSRCCACSCPSSSP